MEKDLIKAISELVPLSRTAKEQIDLLKEWSSTGRARSAFKAFNMQNSIPNDMGHFYPSEFPKYPPKAVRIGKKSVTKYARERGVST